MYRSIIHNNKIMKDKFKYYLNYKCILHKLNSNNRDDHIEYYIKKNSIKYLKQLYGNQDVLLMEKYEDGHYELVIDNEFMRKNIYTNIRDGKHYMSKLFSDEPVMSYIDKKNK